MLRERTSEEEMWGSKMWRLVTAGRPSVSVPVLSNSSIFRLDAASSAFAPCPRTFLPFTKIPENSQEFHENFRKISQNNLDCGDASGICQFYMSAPFWVACRKPCDANMLA
jgi:hypothetical protein